MPKVAHTCPKPLEGHMHNVEEGEEGEVMAVGVGVRGGMRMGLLLKLLKPKTAVPRPEGTCELLFVQAWTGILSDLMFGFSIAELKTMVMAVAEGLGRSLCPKLTGECCAYSA